MGGLRLMLRVRRNGCLLDLPWRSLCPMHCVSLIMTDQSSCIHSMEGFTAYRTGDTSIRLSGLMSCRPIVAIQWPPYHQLWRLPPPMHLQPCNRIDTQEWAESPCRQEVGLLKPSHRAVQASHSGWTRTLSSLRLSPDAKPQIYQG